MSTIEKKPLEKPIFGSSTEGNNNEFEYKSLSKSALACMVFTALGLAAFLAQSFVLIPILAIGFGIVALMGFKQYPEELTGKLPTLICMAVSGVVLVGAIALHSYIYMTEVPDGYTRIGFYELRDNDMTALKYSENAEDLDGKKVFLKGYVRPSDQKTGLQRFILVGDWGDCCFGGNPDITEVVSIQILGEERVDANLRQRKIGGTFRLNRQSQVVNEKDIPRVFYSIECDYLR